MLLKDATLMQIVTRNTVIEAVTGFYQQEKAII